MTRDIIGYPSGDRYCSSACTARKIHEENVFYGTEIAFDPFGPSIIDGGSQPCSKAELNTRVGIQKARPREAQCDGRGPHRSPVSFPFPPFHFFVMTNDFSPSPSLFFFDPPNKITDINQVNQVDVSQSDDLCTGPERDDRKGIT